MILHKGILSKITSVAAVSFFFLVSSIAAVIVAGSVMNFAVSYPVSPTFGSGVFSRKRLHIDDKQSRHHRLYFKSVKIL